MRPDPSIGDGSFANNGWLQELPKPLTKLTWDNAALVSPATRSKLGVTNGDVVKLSRTAGRCKRPSGLRRATPMIPSPCTWVTGGAAPATWARALASTLTHSLLASTSGLAGARDQKTGKTYQLVTTQHHHIMGEDEEREEESVAAQRKLVRGATLEEFRKNPELIREEGEEKRAFHLSRLTRTTATPGACPST